MGLTFGSVNFLNGSFAETKRKNSQAIFLKLPDRNRTYAEEHIG